MIYCGHLKNMNLGWPQYKSLDIAAISHRAEEVREFPLPAGAAALATLILLIFTENTTMALLPSWGLGRDRCISRYRNKWT